MKFLRRLWCAMTDHDYDFLADPEPTCRRCNCSDYWPVRRTVGRLLEDLRRAFDRRHWKGRNDDIPF